MRWSLPLIAAAQAARAGGLIAYPTEAVWGLGCLPDNHQAVRRLLALKQRDAAKGLILIAASLEQLQPFMAPLTEAQTERLRSSWPGPITWLVPARDTVPDWLTGGRPSIAVRVSSHQPVIDLCLASGSALVSTSANLSGQTPARWLWQVKRRFGAAVDACLPGPLGGLRRPTEIRDLVTGALIRAG